MDCTIPAPYETISATGFFFRLGTSTRGRRIPHQTGGIMKKGASRSLWAVVLAAGQGTRMTQVTHLLCGKPLPKQFVPLLSERTLLQETMDRIGRQIPPERTVVVVAEGFEDLARLQLREFRGVEVVAQPGDLGTGPGVLLPLSHVLARDPRAMVAVFPSDHHFVHVEPLRAAIAQAVVVADRAPSGLALLGAKAERAASDLGWIVPVPEADGLMLVQRFVEKPAEHRARQLLLAGGLWNTMVMVGAGSAFWDLCLTHLPTQTRAFGPYVELAATPDAPAYRRRLYGELLPADFSRSVLQNATGLAAVPLVDAGWFDCGTPERLVEWLRSTSDRAGILPRLGPVVARHPATAQTATA
jgi:mannose-1-phosphate guanylyltransferase